MDRKKKEESIIYCFNRNCPQLDCARHDINIRGKYGTMFLMDNFQPDKNGKCKDKIEK